MSKPIALFTAAASIAILSAPAAAQYEPVDDRYADVEQAGEYDGEWDGAWQDEESYIGEWTGTYSDVDGHVIDADYEGTWVSDTRFETSDGVSLYRDGEQRWAEVRPIDGDLRRASNTPRLGYTAAQREEWLGQCRALRSQSNAAYYEEDDDDANGGLLGGLLGAIVGGVAGNRIADGDRLAGTLIGAGVGGLAGAVIGSAIDGDGDNDDRNYYDDDYVIDYCEAYLLNHERGYGQSSQLAYAQQHTGHSDNCLHAHRIVEQEVLIDGPATHHARRSSQRRPVAAPQAGKLLPIR